MKSVSVITRTKNRPILLRRAMSSVLNQTFQDFQWVVVNDGGDTEPVNDIVEQARAKHADLTVLHHPKSRGMEAASNAGIRGSDGEFIVIHDDDDSWEPSFLEKTVGFLRSERGAKYGGVITHGTVIQESCDSQGEYELLAKYSLNKDIDAVYLSQMTKVNVFPPISFLYRRSLFEKINGYDETLPVLGDWDFNLKFLLQSDIGVVPERLANYHHRIISSRDEDKNTVIHGISAHQEHDALIRNRLLREEINSNTIGIGHLVNLGKDFRRIERSVRFVNPAFLWSAAGKVRPKVLVRRLFAMFRSRQGR